MRYLIPMLIVILFCSCQNDIRAKFEITNKTKNTIDSINIKSFEHDENSNFIRLESGQSQTYWFDMTDLPKVDGAYLLKYKDTVFHYQQFGYFTNGYPIENFIKITFETETVLLDYIYNKY